MLEYTKAAIKQTVDDFKKVDYVRNVVTQVLYIAYLIYALIAGNGYLWANIPLLLLSVAYFAFFLVATHKRMEKKLKATVKTVFTRCKQVIKFFTLGLMVYGIWLTAENVTPLGLILSSLMIVGWVLQILFEIILKFFSARVNLIIEGLEADYETMTKPARNVGNFFKKMTGQEIEVKEPSKARLLLDKKVVEAREEQKQLKKEKVLLKKEERKAAKLEKAKAKQAAKEKRLAEKQAKKTEKQRSLDDESLESV